MRGFWAAAVYLAVLGVASHFVGEALPRRWFRPGRAPWRSFAWEKEGRIYLKTGIRHWKDRVPDMSRLMPDMKPKRLASALPGDAELEMLLKETCVAEATHWALILLSPVVCLLWPTGWGIALWLFDVLFLNLPFILIQRYNRPKLAALQNKRRSRGSVCCTV